MRVKTLDAAKGKWRGILLSLGVPADCLTGKHVACPLCGGTDRFRFTNNCGDGSYICNQCGHGSGMQLLQAMKGWDFRTAASEVDAVIGNVEPDPDRPAMTTERTRELMNVLWRAGKTMTDRDLAGIYWRGRGLALPQNSQDFRFVADCRDTEGVMRPSLVMMVRNVDGNPCQLHRTFLSRNGRKADMAMPRAMMPGSIPDGAAIRLANHGGGALGIAEGAETAQSALQRFALPVWAVISTTGMKKWIAPSGVTNLVVFGDNDPKFGGAAAAYHCAHANAVKGISVEVRIPSKVGMDWADEAAA